MIILFLLVLRSVSFEFRGKMDHPGWRFLWESGMIFGSLLPSFLLGFVFFNIFQGLPIDQKGHYRGSALALVNPYAVLGGLLFMFLFFLHGSLWLAIKSEGDLYDRAIVASSQLWILLALFEMTFLIMTAKETDLYQNYLTGPFLCFIPFLIVASLLFSRFFMARKAWREAWFSSCVTIASTLFFGFVGLYPYLLPSNLMPSYRLTIYHSSSSMLALKIMLGIILVVLPIVIIYQIGVYYLFRAKTAEHDLPY